MGWRLSILMQILQITQILFDYKLHKFHRG